MVKLVLISPRKLFEHSFLAGAIFAVAAFTLLVDLAIIALRGYAFNLVSGWTQLSELGDGLEAISYSCLVALVWYIVLAFLVVAIMQIPLVALFLKWELSWFNSITLQPVRWLTQHSTSCEDWWTTIRVVSLTAAIAGLVLHLLILALCGRYVHTRPKTTADLLYTRSKRAKGRHGRKKEASEAREAREKRKRSSRKKGESGLATMKGGRGGYGGYGSDSSEGGLEGAPPASTTSTCPPLPSVPPDIHTDSGSDSAVEKQPLRR
ncbi:proteophosphoglycan ppg4 [Rhodotorula toruloides]|uniref:Proteophosphoglycan ppg4 n=1 Tax=Rhodotorula toruloides TaxID=5286 RepID=A0A511KGX2_RHOTO|nr:proteophosphoglycan ppg4 [Rhodotorula toruloides]